MRRTSTAEACGAASYKRGARKNKIKESGRYLIIFSKNRLDSNFEAISLLTAASQA